LHLADLYNAHQTQRKSEYKNLYERLKVDYANETFKTKELSDKIRVLEEELSKFKRF
jgi:hypothetical protein